MRFITSSAEYRDIYKNNRNIESKLFSLLFTKIPHTDETAVGIVVNKKVGKAVIRNKVKRRVRYFVRSYSEIIKPEFKYIIKAKPLSGMSGWSMIRDELKTLFEAPQLAE